MDVLRVAVNVGCSTPAAAGFETSLAPAMTIGTGFFGRSAVGENIGPEPPPAVDAHRRQQGRPEERLRRFRRSRPLPEPATRPRLCREGEIDYSFDLVGGRPSRVGRGGGSPGGPEAWSHNGFAPDDSALRDEIRQLILEELPPAGREADRGGPPLVHLPGPASAETIGYLGTFVRGSLPRTHVAAQVIEVAPGLDIEPLTDSPSSTPTCGPAILVVERQFGYLELHSHSTVVGEGRRPRRCSTISGRSRGRCDAAGDPGVAHRQAGRQATTPS